VFILEEFMNVISSAVTSLKKAFFLLPVSVFFCAASGTLQTSYALDVSLTAKENADTGIAGYPVNAVIPLPQGRFSDPETLGIDGTAAQIEVLERWPDDNSLRHVSAHFQTTATPHQNITYHFVDKPAVNPPTAVKLTQTADFITVNTGPLQFRLRKSAFNLLDAVWLDRDANGIFSTDERIIASNLHNGGVMKPRSGAGDLQYDAERTGLVWTIEETGPMRAVIRVEARAKFLSTADHRHGFAARIYAYAGKPFVKIDYQLQNSAKNAVRSWPLYLEALNLNLGLNLEGDPVVRYGLGNDTVFKRLRGNGSYLAQERHNRFRIHAKPDNAVLYDSGNLPAGSGPDGFIDVRDSRHGIMAAIRNFWQMWPNGLEINASNRLALQLFPSWSAQWITGYWDATEDKWVPLGSTSPSGLYWLEDMQHHYKEILLYFHTAETPDAQLLKMAGTFQFPPTVSIPSGWHRQTRATLDLGGVIPPAGTIPAVADQRRPGYYQYDPQYWYDASGPYYGANWINFLDPEPGYRSRSCTTGGWPYSDARFIATGNPGDYFDAEGHGQSEINLRPEWMTGYKHDNDWDRLRLSENGYCNGRWRIFEGNEVSKLAAPPLPDTGTDAPLYYARDDEHGWFYHVAEAYFLTGNPWIRDWYRFIAEFRRTRLERLDLYPDTSSRATAHSLHQVLQAYRVTGDRSLLARFREHIRKYLRLDQDPYYGDQKITVEAFGGGYQTGYLMRTIATYLEEVRALKDWQAYAEGFNYLSGLVEWNYNFGNFPYYFDARQGGKGISNGSGLTLVDPQAWYYWHTGKKPYLDQLEQYVAAGINGGEPPYGEFSQWLGQFEARWYLHVHNSARPDNTPPLPVTNLKAVRLDAATLELRWTAPADAARYHIVWSGKPVVEKNSLDKTQRNWWAANAVGPKLVPVTGQNQTLQIHTGDNANVYAALFTFDDRDNMSAMSNVAHAGP
jgi:hypothetical protein